MNNARLGAFVRYFDIQQIKEGNRVYWIAWFYDDVKDVKTLESE
jgi:hypothetical protein